MRLNAKIELLEDQLDKSRDNLNMQANEICNLREQVANSGHILNEQINAVHEDHSRQIQKQLSDLECTHSTALAMKDNELGLKHRELGSLRDELSGLRGDLEAEKLKGQRTKSELE